MTKENHYDVAVIGVGAVGSAALYQLSQKKLKVLAIDSFDPPHAFGSSGGESRIVRQAIGEGEHYVPLALRSYEIWSEIEQKIGHQLLHRVGGLVLSSTSDDSSAQTNDFFSTTVECAQKYHIQHEILDHKDIKRRLPEFNIQDNTMGYYENNAGYVVPEKCILAQINLAKREGVELRFKETVTQILNEAPESICIKTNKSTYSASKVIISAGSWVNNFLSKEISDIFKVYRQVLYWFEIKDKSCFSPDRFPVFIWKFSPEGGSIYGFPAIDGASGGVKMATHNLHTPTSPDLIDRTVSTHEKEDFYKMFIAPHFPTLGPTCLKAAVCSYTVTPDEGFVIDFALGSQDILLVSACSGHGFKHSPAIGEIAANCVLGNTSLKNMDCFSLKRFSMG
ncbi:MAG: N-methyl-L-tryptophan oxidase [Alphaproteobacteria bacterium]|nr:N-methyl-L-tryptophan oxidase [Alphaproteobacteria bacterium]